MGPSLSSLLSQSATPDLKYCRAQDLAARLFSETVKYEGCKICTDPKSAIYKMYIRNDQDCNTAQINPTRYWPGDRGCPPEASEIEFCALSKDELYKNNNSSDCPDQGYQLKKGQFSERLRACNLVLETTNRVKPSDGSPIPLASMCPADVFTYLKCDRNSHQCTYTTTSKDQAVIDACKNSFENCQDPEYLQDKAVWTAYNEQCKAKWDSQNNWNFWMPLVSGVIMGLMLLAVVYSAVIGTGVTSSNQMTFKANTTGNGAGGGVLCALKSGWIVGIAIMGLFASIWPGMIAKSQQWPPFWNTDDAFLVDEGDSSTYLYGGIAMAVISFLLLVLCIVAYLMPSCTPVVPVMASGFGNRLVASTR